jgi:hypothetical protein
MNLPFTTEEFFQVFEVYNSAIWPVHVVAYLLGVAAIICAFSKSTLSDRLASGFLAAFWIWTGVFYHILHFATINRVAFVFGFFFVLQGVFFVIFGFICQRVSFQLTRTAAFGAGACLIIYALVVYQLLGIVAGHDWPRIPLFGVAPCPTVIFTFGLLLWAVKPIPFFIYFIPLLWALVGTSAAISLGVPQDYGLTVSGFVYVVLVIIPRLKHKSTGESRRSHI